MMPDFLLYALLCGLAVAAVCGPLGAFVVWRRMSYFGDTLAHGALLGAACGVLLQIQPLLAVLGSSVLLALLLAGLHSRSTLANDTLLGILSHTALALGLVVAGFITDQKIDLYAILFGDLLTSSREDVIIIAALTTGALLILKWFWDPLILATLDTQLAKVEGVPVERLNLLLMCIVAVVVAMAMKVVGVLLITALLIIPAAASRCLTRSPESMAVLSAILGMLAVAAGLTASVFWDTPAGPSIVLAASTFFLLTFTITGKRR